jgi:hypothetical protein
MLQPIGLWSGGGGGFGAYNPNSGAIAGGIGGDIKNLGYGTLSMDVVATYEKDAVNISDSYGCAAAPGNGCAALGAAQVTLGGWPTTFPGAYLKATLSNQTAVMATAKYSFGSWGNTPVPVVGKAVPPSGPTGIPLTLYAGYEWIQYANPSDPQSAFRDDGFLFADPSAGALHGAAASINGTAINNNAFNASCGRGLGCSDEIFQIIWVGAKYGITKDLDVIGAYYHYIQNQYVTGFAPGTASTASCATPSNFSQCAGWLDVYSAVLDWRFLPKWDTYIGVMWSAAFGGIANGDIARQNLAATGGVRFRF